MTLHSTLEEQTGSLAVKPRLPASQAKSVVVHSGARDGYQLARALSEAGMLETLVTDLYWPADQRWAQTLSTFIPKRLMRMARQRNEPRLPSSEVRSCAAPGITTLLLDKIPRMPFSLRRKAARHTDAVLGRTAGALATRRHCGLVSYSYYGYQAFSHFVGAGVLFQLHPHPLSMRRLLTEELQMHPDCAESLQQEWELALPEEDFRRLVDEITLPSHILAASSFTRTTLVENGIDPEQITVIPYGVDSRHFHPSRLRRQQTNGKLKLLFVGRINQRKGVKYLLEALRLLNSEQVELTICGRVVDGLELFKAFSQQVEIRPSVSNEELLEAYQSADLFVLPSIAEGFGQVLLESLACGLPILSTTHTAAPDLIEHGNQGFFVEPRRPDLLAERIDWALSHRGELEDMSIRARLRAEVFTWQRFRTSAVDAIRAHHARHSEVR